MTAKAIESNVPGLDDRKVPTEEKKMTLNGDKIYAGSVASISLLLAGSFAVMNFMAGVALPVVFVAFLLDLLIVGCITALLGMGIVGIHAVWTNA